VRAHFERAADGVCPECAGRTTTTLERVANPDATAPTATSGDGHALEAIADCQQCGNHLAFPVGLLALDDPDVVRVLEKRGLDPGATPFWELPVLDDDAVAQRGTDPLEATVTIRKPDAASADHAESALDVVVTADLDARITENH
jgi:hypothetical protein